MAVRERIVSLSAPVILFLIFFSACQKQDNVPEIYKESRVMMGTVVEIKVVATDESRAGEAIGYAFDEIDRIEKKMDWRRTLSDVARINRGAGKGEGMFDEEMFGFLERSLDLCHKTGGAFDVSIGPLTRLWKFDMENSIVPDPESIKSKLVFIDYKKIILDKIKRSVKLTFPEMSLDLGGIGKGYAVDRAVEVLKSYGISAGIVDAGGDMRLFGKKPDNRLWHIGIRNPRQKDEVLASIRITDKSIVTSGDYERFFIKDGQRFHHILDPSTGYPARGCMSVTVIAETAFLADAMATAVFVRGSADGFKLLQSQTDLEGLIIGADKRKFITSGLEKNLVWSN